MYCLLQQASLKVCRNAFECATVSILFYISFDFRFDIIESNTKIDLVITKKVFSDIHFIFF